MRYSSPSRRKGLHERLDSKHGGTRLRLQVLAAVAVLALLVAWPMLDSKPPPVSAQAEQAGSERATMDVDSHRKAVFAERRRLWEAGQDARLAEGSEKR